MFRITRNVCLNRIRTHQRKPAGSLVTTFGCTEAELERLTSHDPIVAGHRGLLQREEVAALLAETDVFLDLSIYQAFGRTALEAMACGATAVVPRRGGVWEFVEQGSPGGHRAVPPLPPGPGVADPG